MSQTSLNASADPAPPSGNTSTAPRPLKIAHPTMISTIDLRKSYYKGRLEVPVLRGVDLVVNEGKMVSIIGQSGSGKSTLLHLLGTLDQPDAGEIWFRDTRIDRLPIRKRDRFRNRQIGMIFQFYHLLPELTTLENVMVPRMIERGVWGYFRSRRHYRERAAELLELVGLGHRLNHKPKQLSGGEMQRTAIARALISQPTLLLADEPTGNLDRQNSRDVLNTLKQLNRDEGLTIVIVTHDEHVAQQSDAVVHLAEGKVVDV